ncbi:MAG: caspase family protein [Novosphingobium sp.]
MSVLRLIIVLLLLAPLPAWAAAGACEQFPAARKVPGGGRVALIIENSDYAFAGRLENPAYDAVLVRKALANIGFAVTVCPDREREAMLGDLAAFRRAADGGEIALIYFAGHGMRVGSDNWLLPVGFDPNGVVEEGDFADLAVSHRAMIRYLGRAATRIVILDACRNNPFEQAVASRMALLNRDVAVTPRTLKPAAQHGLAAVEEDDVFVMFSAAAGQFAQDGPPDQGSPFANVFAAEVQRPGIELRLVAGRIKDAVVDKTGGEASRTAQRPYKSDNLGGREVFLNGAPARSALVGEEAAAFDACNRGWTKACWEGFVRRFPEGTNIRTARLVLASFAPAPPATQAAAPAGAAEALAAMTPADWSAGDHNALRARLVAVHGRETIDRLAASGDPRAAWIAAGAYEYGLAGYPFDRERARTLFEVSATANFGAGLASLGYDYQYGTHGRARDLPRALGLFRSSAAQGYAIGQSNLGVMYRDGTAVLKDEAEALRLFRLAAAQGFVAAEVFVGEFTRDGKGGLTADPREAVNLFRRAADLGSTKGQRQLAAAYFDGIGGLPKSPQEAVRLLRLAIAQHDDDAINDLGIAYDLGSGGLPVDRVEARRLYKVATDEDNASGQYNYALLLRSGEGGPTDPVAALALFRSASARGLADATAMLGVMTEYGEAGLAPDREAAIAFYRQAVAAGSGFASEQLRRLGVEN